MKLWVTAAAAVLLAGSAHAFAQARERVTAPVGGFSIEKPPGWFTLPAEASIANMRGLDYDSPEFQRAVEANASAPLLIFTKYPANHPGVVPTLKVNYRRLPQVRQAGAVAVVGAVIESPRRAFGEVRILDAPAETRIGGLPAGHARVAYTLKAGGNSLPAVSETWIVARGDYILIIGASWGADAPESVRAEMQAAVGSIQIAP